MPVFWREAAKNGNPEKEEEIQRDESGKVHGTRDDRRASSGAEDPYIEGIAKRLEAQANAREIAFGRVSINQERSVGP